MESRILKVLIIEDDPDILENISEILEIEGFKVSRADDGLHGIVLALSSMPDLVICDMLTPAFDGCRVLEFFKRNPSTSTIPFVFLSKNSNNAELVRCKELGAEHFITKPYKDQEILRCVYEIFGKEDKLNPEASVANLVGDII